MNPKEVTKLAQFCERFQRVLVVVAPWFCCGVG
jgi:hypothetical protein